MAGEDKIEYKPIPLTDLLIRLKNLSQIMMSLAFCSVFFRDESLYVEMEMLDDKIDYLKSLLIMQASLATRDGEDATKMLSVFDMVSSVDKISEVSLDIAKLAHEHLTIDIGDYLFINSATNFIFVFEVDENSPFISKTIKEIYEDIQEVFDVVAVRRSGRFIISPSEDFTLYKGDKLYIKGLTSTIRKVLRLHGVEKEASGLKLNRDILENIIYIKNLSEFMIDIAYSTLFTSSKDLAYELESMEETIDEITEELKLNVMEDSQLSNKEKLALIEFIDSCEYLADAAIDMTYSIRKGGSPHPIIERILEKTDERYIVLKIPDILDGKEIAQLNLSKFGVDILALKRGGYWYLNPPIKGWKLRSGDQIIIQYYKEAEEEVKKLIKNLEIKT